MSWSFWLLCVPTASYLLASVAYAMQRNWPLCTVYFGYFIGNLGLLAVDAKLAH